MIDLKKPSQKVARPPRVKNRTKVRTTRQNKESRSLKKPRRTWNKGHTKPSETLKEMILLLLGPTLLPQRKKQARIGSEARTETFPRSPPIFAIRRDIIQENVPSQKTSISLGDFHVDDWYKRGGSGFGTCPLYLLSGSVQEGYTLDSS